MTDVVPIRRALISVADKRGLVELGRRLSARGVSIVSSGSTAEALRAAGVAVKTVAEVTGQPEMLGGRVKTLHPAIHGGILADRRNPDHVKELERLAIEPFDLVVVNLYPFEETVASGADRDAVVEQIDIGGPTLVRAAAKNFESVAVVVEPARYETLGAELSAHGGLSRETRMRLAAEAFELIAGYDAAIAQWFSDAAGAPSGSEVRLLDRIVLRMEKAADLRYGENPHQGAALYAAEGAGPLGGAAVLQGKEMSYNNWLDAEAAMILAAWLPEPAAAIIKHTNPCGAALGATAEEAYRRARDADPLSAFGNVTALNVQVDGATAMAITDIFTDVVVAPGYTQEAREKLAQKGNLRVVEASFGRPVGLEVRPISGGALVQVRDTVSESREDFEVASSRKPTDEEWRDLLFAWIVAARVKSNAIVLASGEVTVGIGAGQMSRVDSVDIACRKAGDRSRGASLASDALIPFRDGVDRAAEAGVTAVIQPGGSVRDDEVLAAAEEHGMAMVLTGRRHFRH